MFQQKKKTCSITILIARFFRKISTLKISAPFGSKVTIINHACNHSQLTISLTWQHFHFPRKTNARDINISPRVLNKTVLLGPLFKWDPIMPRFSVCLGRFPRELSHCLIHTWEILHGKTRRKIVIHALTVFSPTPGLSSVPVWKRLKTSFPCRATLSMTPHFIPCQQEVILQICWEDFFFLFV